MMLFRDKLTLYQITDEMGSEVASPTSWHEFNSIYSIDGGFNGKLERLQHKQLLFAAA